MELKNKFGFELKYRSVVLLSMLVVIPNLLGLLDIPTMWGFKIHIFQYMVFVAAFVLGPLAGLIAGGFGSVMATVSMGNPVIFVGNMWLGFLVGLFSRRGFGNLQSVGLAMAIQLPFVMLADFYLIGMPFAVLWKLLLSLFVCDLLWAVAATKSAPWFMGLVAKKS